MPTAKAALTRIGPMAFGSAWDQSVRLVPVEMRLAEGQILVVRAGHDHEACRVGLPQVHPSMVAGCVGHLELFDPRHAQEQLEQLFRPLQLAQKHWQLQQLLPVQH